MIINTIINLMILNKSKRQIEIYYIVNKKLTIFNKDALNLKIFLKKY